MQLIPVSENLTHVSKDFLTKEELEILESGEQALRVMPYCAGGQIYKITKGGYHYATLQEMGWKE